MIDAHAQIKSPAQAGLRAAACHRAVIGRLRDLRQMNLAAESLFDEVEGIDHGAETAQTSRLELDEERDADADWIAARKVKTVESKEEYPKGWRPATLYRLRVNPKRVCLYFSGEEYEGTVMLRIRTDQKQLHFLQQRIILFVSQV